MKYTTALIAYSGTRHTQHNKILADLQHEKIDQRNIDLPLAEGARCAVIEEINNEIKLVDLLIVYLSKQTKDHPCINYCIESANKKNIRIIGIWLDDAEPQDLGACMDQLGDGVCVYDENFIDNIIGETPTWTNPDGTPPAKRKINKHICG
jgi:hypothetical protein